VSELPGVLPQYEIGAEIGRGATGVVHAGYHRALARDVAVKRLPAALANEPDMRARFGAEARLLAQLDHPHIVPVYDYVESDTACLLVLERLDGGTLWDIFNRQGLSMEQSCAITLAILSGLEAAHQSSVLHLDVKPANVLFGRRGTLKVADFGIARMIGGGQTLATSDGRVIGTPSYMAPEQITGSRLTPATDVYAVATVLYLTLGGTLPHSNEGGVLAVVHRHAYEQPQPISPTVPGPLAEAVMRGLSRDAVHRPTSAEQFAVLVAQAAGTCFGPGWLDRAGLPLHLAPAVLAAATRTGTGVVPVPAQPMAGTTIVLPAAQPTVALNPPVVGLDDVNVSSLVPVQEVIRRPPSALPAFGVAAVGAVLLGMLALLGPASAPAPGSALNLSVGGNKVTGSAVTADLSAPQRLAGTSTVPGPAQARMSLSLAGIPLGRTESPGFRAVRGSWRATVSLPPVVRWVVGGAVRGRVELVAADGSVTAQEFDVHPQQAPYLTLMGTGSLLLLLFVLAYLESLLRSLRRGRRRASGPVAAAFLGIPLGAVAALAAAVFTRQVLSEVTLAGCAVLGVAVTLATALGARRRGQANSSRARA
jgi:serine/threonine-protein kinase